MLLYCESNIYTRPSSLFYFIDLQIFRIIIFKFIKYALVYLYVLYVVLLNLMYFYFILQLMA